MTETKFTNRLIHETSPYLLQHAHNPVAWYPWGEEAFMEAKRRDLPLLVSIGYSACHWCHVMERESFENPDIAALMNRYFVNIKVDREERPDIDQIYQHAVQAITGQGGWPLTVFMDHERQPFYGGTYFPPDRRYGRMAFPEILEQIHLKWVGERETLSKAGAELTGFLEKLAAPGESENIPEAQLPRNVSDQILSSYDPNYGGFGRAPKFPNPTLLQLLLRVGWRDKAAQTVEPVLHTLRRMARGGIYDQLGGGFHRYSTDRHWLVPHFEKMLYDNAQLLRLYCIGAQIEQTSEFRTEFQNVVFETADYLRREMTAPDGGFYATQDADSEGEEGKFFLWRIAEINQVLSPGEARLFSDTYHLTEEGNFEGRNILHRSVVKDALHTDEQARLIPIKAKLLQVREQRVKPFRDEKIITSWNGLAIGGMAYAYQVFQRQEDYDSARRAAEFIWSQARLADGGLARIFKDGQAKVAAMLDDYAFLAQGFLELFEADFSEQWLGRSIELCDAAMAQFGDARGRYYLCKATEESVIARPLSGYDQAIPSGVSVLAENLLKIAVLTGNGKYRTAAEDIFKAYHREMMEEGWGHAALLGALHLYHQGFKEFVFVSEDNRLPDLLEKLWDIYQPDRVLIWRNIRDVAAPTYLNREYWEGRQPIDGQPACYVCADFRCLPPVTRWLDLEAML